MENEILKILACHPEGCLASVIVASVSSHFNVTKEEVSELLSDMHRENIIGTKTRVFRDGDPGDSDILYCLNTGKVEKIAPNQNINRLK
ncbi:MAG: hypothetical protein NC453_15330 [Muribaculum sp.]|nr:hypothetical protein [Muribaculum sp.]